MPTMLVTGRLQQGVGRCIALHLRNAANTPLASTLYKPQSTMQARRFISLPGPFSPTLTKLASDTSASAKNDSLEDFGVGYSESASPLTKSASPTAREQTSNRSNLKRNSKPFHERKANLLNKLKGVKEGGQDYSIKGIEFRHLMDSTSNLEELKGCLEVSSFWNSSIEDIIGNEENLKPLGPSETGNFNNKCFQTDYPELAFYALINRKEFGLEYSVNMQRKIQPNLIKKFKNLSMPNQEGRLDKLLESQALLEGSVASLKEWNEETAGIEDQEDAELLRAQLSFLNSILTLAAVIPSARQDIVSIDIQTTLQAVSCLLDVYKYEEETNRSDVFLEKQIQPRLNATLQVLVSQTDPENLAKQNPVYDYTLLRLQPRLLKCIESNGYIIDGKDNETQLKKSIEALMETIPQATKDRFNKKDK